MTNYTPGSLVASQQMIDSFIEPIVLINARGTLLKANKEAKKLLEIDELHNELIETYLNFDLSNNIQNKVLLRSKNKYIRLKVIELNEDLYFLIMLDDLIKRPKNIVKKQIERWLNISDSGMLMYDTNGIIDCNDCFLSMFNYEKNSLKKLHLDDLFVNDKETMYGIKENGIKFPVELIYSSKCEEDITVVLIRDISTRTDYEKQIEKLAYYSELTELPNKNLFILKLKEAIEKAAEMDYQIAVFYVDLNYFKAINETLGYNFGDKLLRACGRRLQKVVQGMPSFVSHIHGDEFLIMQTNIMCDEDIDRLGEQLIHSFEKPIIINDHHIYISISVGISVYPTDSTHPHKLIKHAHSAMYVINEKNRDRYFRFNESITKRFQKRLMIEEGLRNALEYQEFELYYQPQVCIKKNKVIGVEALIRWNHPEKGMISPLDFIPFAEKTGLIIDIDRWVIYKACKQSVKWEQLGYTPITISVNISAKQFFKRGFVQFLKQTIKETNVNPANLELEITESVAMTREQLIIGVMQDIRDLGVSVAIDDFGTGYSSLKHLSLYPINKLKIDKMFVQNLQNENKKIVKSIVHLSHALNMKVVAEGVETEQQKYFLKKLNCDQLQGYYYSKPLPETKIVQFFTKQMNN